MSEIELKPCPFCGTRTKDAYDNSLTRRVKELEGALEIYANESNWRCPFIMQNAGHVHDWDVCRYTLLFGMNRINGYDIAQQALAPAPTGTGGG